MSLRESSIWNAFLASGRLPPGRLWYDTRVGERIPQAWGEEPWLSAVIRATSRKRIDACLRTTDSWIIYEVKVRAGLSAVGQCIGYQDLYSRAIAGNTPVLMVIVCDYWSLDMDTICRMEGIGLWSRTMRGGGFWIPPSLLPAI